MYILITASYLSSIYYVNLWRSDYEALQAMRNPPPRRKIPRGVRIAFVVIQFTSKSAVIIVFDMR